MRFLKRKDVYPLDTTTITYRFLTLIAISGECSTEALPLLGASESYGEKVITKLKEDNLIKTHYKDKLRGYRLTNVAKKLLLLENPNRFSFFLSGQTETNHPKSDYPRRLRLQQASILYVLMQNADIKIFRDEKPALFHPLLREPVALSLPVFYHSREIKELGAEQIKINNSRTLGILLTGKTIFAVYYTGNSTMKWEYRTELKVKAMLSYHVSQGILSTIHISPAYHPNTPFKALIIGENMDTALKLLNSDGGYKKSYFCLDASFEYFHYAPASSEGITLLKLLCSYELIQQLKQLLLSDLYAPCPDFALEHDAVYDNRPVLLAFDFDMLRISRFSTALSLHGLYGHLICFDFQKEVLQQYFGESVTIETIDLDKFERRFLS